jgi:hypothetical protein
MAEQIQPQRRPWLERFREARSFWLEYVYAAREDFCGLELDPSDEMRIAMNEYFKKIDVVVSNAIETGCIYMRHRDPAKHPEITVLLFSDGKGKTFQRSFKMDHRFSVNGRPLDFQDYWWFRFAITIMIFAEKKVKPDPRGGYFCIPGREDR